MYKVLIIDDDKLARKGLISMVKWEDYGLTIAGDVANGMQALQFLETSQVDLAFVDLSMPVLSGMDFIRESRQKYPDLKYVILTFHEDFENVQNALRYGVLDYISKLRLEEMDNEEVFARIGRLMQEADEKKGSGAGLLIGDGSAMKTEEISYEKMEELRLEWTGGQWIYNDRLFEEMCESLKESHISIRQMERLLMWISQEMERSFEVVLRAPWLKERKEGTEWLYFCREKIREEAKTICDYHNLRVCILRAVFFMKENIGTKLSAELVAGKVNMSRSYFSVNFKTMTGETFNDFLKEERLHVAKELLKKNNMKTADLAEMLGYEDYKYFARLFFHKTGMSCLEYAKQFSSGENKI